MYRREGPGLGAQESWLRGRQTAALSLWPHLKPGSGL